ncbi:MAG: formimidoylglutamate deiminase [Actinobacteria bacterium]|uniref:Unannotated protein n=1 Tax=freshwater metagenome TaxID=449393 RepID=A0A6J6ZVE5_9ZZZZ|nr:formimidoylglutamate deiminase [Actinomycetota bacterium]MSW76577.1 formimidoylglutamate deiminase [Actinomycetota bacterium]MSX93324.1 formimidoylglutamate deiminase [Actinomycetota bacterium]MSZ82465.1 formimidoylglutamate deiminase [Actinomycetota bacterium]MTB16356.1 formimidoylglutamate deiminase [Actinomycetota bacterium]
MTEYWCEFAWLGGDTAVEGVVVEITGELITAVSRAATCPPGAERLSGLTLPGLANAHSHAFHRALRSRTQVGTGSFWTWRDQMYELARTLNPQSYHRLARAVFGEMALAGITTVGEFHYLHHGERGTPYADPNAMSEALMAAAGEAGIRITLLDACYLHGGIGTPPNEVQQRFSDGSAEAWAVRTQDALERFTTPISRVGAAIHSVRAVDSPSMRTVAEWAAERALPLHAHVSEQKSENEECIAKLGLTPVGLLAEQGVLGLSFTAVHATHLSGVDIDLLGVNGSTICMCPTTERDLADGIGPAAGLVLAGARLALGSDSHAVIDLFEEARAVELDERLATNVRGQHTASSLLRAATAEGQSSLGWHEMVGIAVGAPADLVTVSLDGVRTAGTTVDHALEAAVFAAGATDVRQVMVGGRVIVRDGRHLGFDVTAELAEVLAGPRT